MVLEGVIKVVNFGFLHQGGTDDILEEGKKFCLILLDISYCFCGGCGRVVFTTYDLDNPHTSEFCLFLSWMPPQ